MKRLLLSSAAAVFLFSPAYAADMPMRAPAYKAMPYPMFSWTGCYVGANAGGVWARQKVTDVTTGGTETQNPDGFIGGGQIGCDYQSGPWVFGLEGMFDWANADETRASVITPGATLHGKLNWLTTATARIGYAVDRSLWYVKGGAAWAEQSFGQVAPALNATTGDFTSSGWTVGAGIEYSFAPNWSAKLEYNYADFGSHTRGVCDPVAGCLPANIDLKVQTVLLGLNYRFGDWGKGPISARY